MPEGAQSDLIYDVGLHQGLDTAFYLAKGFRVVAVEADPALAAAARQRFADAIAAGRLTIVEAAIAPRAGTVRFHRNPGNSEWGTIDDGFAARNARFGAPSETVEVPAVTFGGLLRTHGVPHYLKVDIEGADHLCIEALPAAAARPHYVSFETAGPARFGETFAQLATLHGCGYGGFQLLNQARLRSIRLPDPPREGRYVAHRFRGGSSGPFGAELPGRWQGLEDLLRTYLPALAAEQRWSINGGDTWLVRLRGLLAKWRLCPAFGWFDLHARLGPAGAGVVLPPPPLGTP